MMPLSISKFNAQNHSIVIWSEAKHYWETFYPLIQYFQKNKIQFIYLASDKNDKGLTQLEHAIYIGKNWFSFRFLNRIKSDIMIMTTPGLGDTAIKRSKKVQHYCHIVHAISDIYNYQRCSFECFDSILCSSPHQINSIRKLEKIRGTEEKQLFETGCLYYDEKVKNKSSIETDDNTILYAPSWGSISSLTYANSIIDSLLSHNYNVIFRPHPQSFKSNKKLLKQLQKTYKNKIQWDIGTDGSKAFAKSRVMISDISMVVFDFAFLYNKPVISIDYPIDHTGKENEKLHLPIWELDQRHKIGYVIKTSEIQNIDTLIQDIKHKEIKNTYINKNVFNFGTAGDVAGQQIMQILQGAK